jgi:hypothetical protein
MSNPRTCISLPEVEDLDDFAFETEPVSGPYGITMEVADLQHVVAWQEQRTSPYHGYYRLILPPLVKTLQARLKARYLAAPLQGRAGSCGCGTVYAQTLCPGRRLGDLRGLG